jgi:trehalose 6-phosphate synthase/phosphatase
VKENDRYRYVESTGGLASGLRAFTDKMKEDKSSYEEILWLGWPGAAVDERDQEKVKREMREKFGTSCVFLSEELMDKFYLGFCNNTIWPLFHYFPVYTSYETEHWEVYKIVNEIFCTALMDLYQPGDIIWIHDYHLMLLPAMIREKIPAATIGFFLHIPFPSYEIFRLLPSKWRKQILEGLYGSDLVGFHTHDYRSYFLQSSLRILGTEDHMGEVMFNNRMVKVDSFPMGIDYQKYSSAVKSRGVKIERRKLEKTFGRLKLILSIDRQDYSKGILNRMVGYELFLDRYPEWKEKVTMMMVVVPSRIGVEHYQVTKSQIDELVGRINGKHGTMRWTPVLYQYRSLSFDELIAVYSLSDVALITPLRDGMNLIAKEFIATRYRKDGVLILSEMAGSADELAEAIIINPNNLEEISESLQRALKINKEDQANRITIMQNRLMSYDIFKWTNDFLTTLDSVKEMQERLDAKFLRASERQSLISHFKNAKSRILFLDYDGTMVPFADRPEGARPNETVLTLLANLAALEKTDVVLVSGRDRETLEQWFGHLPVSLVAEHGIFLKEPHGVWTSMKPVRKSWKKRMLPVFKTFAEKLPGAFIEDKEYSLAFHYRKADPQLAGLRVKELVGYLMNLISNLDVQILQGNMVLELRNAGIDKGVAAMHWLALRKSEFILAIGDDKTDEDLFRVMPAEAYSIKVGHMPSYAKFNLDNHVEVAKLLNELLEQGDHNGDIAAGELQSDIVQQKIP